jgi:transposase
VEKPWTAAVTVVRSTGQRGSGMPSRKTACRLVCPVIMERPARVTKSWVTLRAATQVPDSKHEALRDLVRAREATKEDQLRAKHRLLKYLLRYVGRRRYLERLRPVLELEPFHF